MKYVKQNIFTVDTFLNKFGKDVVKCGIYFDKETGVSTLIPQEIIYMTLEDLILGNFDKTKFQNVMCKILFTDTSSPLSQYFDNITGNKKWHSITIRISYGIWHFPEHYDCVDNECVIAYGERKLLLNGKYYHLKQGDSIFIKSGDKHEFWSDIDGLNILINLINKSTDLKCDTDFQTDYPEQTSLNKNNFWSYENDV